MINLKSSVDALSMAILLSTTVVSFPGVAAAEVPSALVAQCKKLIQQDSWAQRTADSCLFAEGKIRSSSPNSEHHVEILEQLGLLAGYSKYLDQGAGYYYENALDAARRGFGNQSPETIEPLTNLAALANSEDDWKGAREFSLQALAAIRENLSSQIAMENSSLSTITQTYRMEGKLSPQTYRVQDHLKVQKDLLHTLRRANTTKPWEKRDIGIAVLEVGFLEMKAGLLDQAEKSTKEAHSILVETHSGQWISIAKKQVETIDAMR